MKYDPITFKKLHKKHMRGRTYTADEPVMRREYINTGAPLLNLIASVLMKSVVDYRLAIRLHTYDVHLMNRKEASNVRDHRAEKRMTAINIAREAGFASPLHEVKGYFAGNEFLLHCALCNIDPDYFLKFWKVSV